MYQREAAKDNQCDRWKIDILEWLERENFKNIWEAHKKYYDKTFVEHFDQKFAIS